MKEKFIPADKQNFDRRQRFIILHYTALEEKDSVETLTRGGVGAHFLIPKESCKNEGESFDYYQFLDINDRAWHAGKSDFAGRSGLNDTSIGIEIVNYGYGLKQDSGEVLFTYQVENQLKEYITETLEEKDENFYQLLERKKLLTAFLSDMMRGLVPPPDCGIYQQVSSYFTKRYKQLTKEWRLLNDPFLNLAQQDLFSLEQERKLVWDDFTDHQLKIIEKLIKEKIEPELIIKDEKTGTVCYQIPPQFITGHADIAPGRKTDPGPRLFEKLAKRDIGAWPDKQLVATIEKEIQIEPAIDYKWIQDNLRFYGYKIESTGQLDEQTKDVIRAFQMHFEPENYPGVPSVKTISILEALIKKYYPDKSSDYPRSFNLSNEKKVSSFFREVSPNSDASNTISPYNCPVAS